MYAILGDYTHTICCVPYIKFGDTKMPVTIGINSFSFDLGGEEIFIKDTAFGDYIIDGKNLYENITELDKYLAEYFSNFDKIRKIYTKDNFVIYWNNNMYHDFYSQKSYHMIITQYCLLIL